LINSGGASGLTTSEEAVATAVINKRAGGTGLSLAAKLSRPHERSVQLLKAIRTCTSAPKSTVA